MRAYRRGRGMDVHHAGRHVGELVRRTHLLLLRLHEGRLPQRPGGPEQSSMLNRFCVSCVSIVPCEAPVALVCVPISCTRLSPRQKSPATASSAQSPKSRSVSTTSARSASGSTQMKAACLAEMAERSRRVLRARPVRRFGVPDLETQPPVVGPLHPVTGQHAVQTGKLHASSPRRAVCSETSAGRSRSPANAARSATVDVAAESGGRRAAVQRGSPPCPAVRTPPRPGSARTRCPTPAPRSRPAR